MSFVNFLYCKHRNAVSNTTTNVENLLSLLLASLLNLLLVVRLNCIKSQLMEVATVHHWEGHVKLNSVLKINIYCCLSLNRHSFQFSKAPTFMLSFSWKQMGFHNCYGYLDNKIYLESIGPRLSECLFDDFCLCSS